MADPFEVRLRYSTMLQKLNASVASAHKAAAFALKHRDLDEDLHSCIVEQLQKPDTPLNKRANIMYFFEHFLDLARREGHPAYIGLFQRDIVPIVDAVAPDAAHGAANVKVVRHVVTRLRQKGYLDAHVAADIHTVLKERETDLALASPAPAAHDGPVPDEPSVLASASAAGHNDNETGTGTGSGRASHVTTSAFDGLSKAHRKQIEERIEEDRERHKRLRESIWAVPPGTDAEMHRLWDETSDLGDDDHLLGDEEQAQRAALVRLACAHRG